MNRIKVCKLEGKVKVPSSKSLSHRALICAALAQGTSTIENLNFCDDTVATIEGLKQLGAKIEIKDDLVRVKGLEEISSATIDCCQSGSTIRFLMPIGLMTSNNILFTGDESLLSRPMTVYTDLFNEQISFENPYFKVSGRIKNDYFEIPGNISSQFISGLLFVLPLLNYNTKIIIKGMFESESYVDLTIDMLRDFGINVIKNKNELFIEGNQVYKNTNVKIEADCSAMAFYAVANKIGNNINIENNLVTSLQSDFKIFEILDKEIDRIDVSDCPDLVPILAVWASLRNGKTTYIENALRLRLKESDRLESISSNLIKLGASIEVFEDKLVITGKEYLNGNIKVSSFKDHRIAMSMAIAASKIKGWIELDDLNVVNKSYTRFWEDFKMLGGSIDE